MNKFSKVIALTLSATMIFGSSLTAFADEPVTSSTGAGKPEGHVDKKVTNVVLPTTVADTTFAYTMDPEKLIEVTSHGKYGDDVVFPSANDTYVYFNNGTNDDNKTVYANTSAAVTITNKSSHDINLKVSAAATASQEGKDIPLVAKDAYASASDPSLYLGLIVGSKAAVAIAEETPADQTVTIPGTEDNFKIAVKDDNSGYEYRVLSLAEWTALDGNSGKQQKDFDETWKNTTISLEGGVTTGKSITSETTAPSVEVTWSWTDPTANAAPSITTTDFAILERDEEASIDVNLGLGDLAATGITAVNWNGNNLLGSTFTYSDGVLTVGVASVNYALDHPDDATYEVVFNDDAETKVSFTLTAKE